MIDEDVSRLKAGWELAESGRPTAMRVSRPVLIRV
jgi:hypothetical protein